MYTALYNIQSQLERSDVITVIYVYGRIRLEGLLYDAERDLLAIAKFLVYIIITEAVDAANVRVALPNTDRSEEYDVTRAVTVTGAGIW